MYLYRDLRVELSDNLDKIKFKLARKLSIKQSDINNLQYFKKSIDARNTEDIFFICSLLFDSSRKIEDKKISIVEEKEVFPSIEKEELKSLFRPVIVGFGPSGMFAALYLARKGLKPIIVEQGKCVEERKKDVDKFHLEGKLDNKSNVCFGEGGAGTFSDGKLNTNNSDKKIRLVLNEFYNHGASKDILYEGKPHIGTDKLLDTVKNIREEIIELGGEIFFNTTFKEIVKDKDQIIGCIVENNNEKRIIETDSIFLAIGHSSFETYKYLYGSNIALEKKDFAIGFRIQHKQEFINKSQYGKFYNSPYLPPASYKLISHLDNGRVVFSFCNCPGGEIVNSSTKEDGICCNGMSNHDRNGEYSNCAILVNVKKEDIMSDNPLQGIIFQQNIEYKAFKLVNSNKLVVQKTTDFINNIDSDIKDCHCNNLLEYVNLNNILPLFIEESLKKGLLDFNNKIKGFCDDSYLFGVETRSSSPIRILRKDTLESISLDNLYVIGEGAGASGGIMTSSIDGINAAISYVDKLKKGKEDEE